MKICIVSDSHDHRERLRAAVVDAMDRGAEAVLHCGDLVAPSTLHGIQDLGLPVHVIHGNNMGDVYHLARLAQESGGLIRYHGADAALKLHGRRIFMVHYPHYARAMACTGDWDLVCNGHEHRAHVERVTNQAHTETVLLDPGTVGGVSAPATYVLGDLETMDFAILAVPEPGTVRLDLPLPATRP